VISLYDVNGNLIGEAVSGDDASAGGTLAVAISGKAGTAASETPEYIRVEASQIGGGNFGGEICIAWLSTTSSISDGGDFRSWNAGTAKFCGVPWYYSTAQLPGVATPYQPPCFWMSADGRFVQGFSAKLFDFFFPNNANPANASAEQWTQFPDTLCKAPARQQFYNSVGACMPFYPSGLSVIGKKDPATGFDLDFDAIESSYTLSCSADAEGRPLSAAVPFNCVSLDPSASPFCIDTASDVTLPASIASELRSDLTFNLGGGQVTVPPPAATDGAGNFGGVVGEIPKDGIGNFGGVVGEIPASDAIARRSPDRISASASASASILIRRAGRGANAPPAITAAPSHPPQRAQKQKRSVDAAAIKNAEKRKEPVLNRRIESRAEEPHHWCKENHLVISEFAEHSAIEVCESESSWGPDFVSITEGIFCDMCERQSYLLCDQGSGGSGSAGSSVQMEARPTSSFDPSAFYTNATATGTSASHNKASGICFDLSTKQLKALAAGRYRRDVRVPVKRYDDIQHWK
jgi:hypothetical protein